jgi:hypothetical protein
MINSKRYHSKLSLFSICTLLIVIMAFTSCGHATNSIPSSSVAIAGTPASLPISVNVNLLPYSKDRLNEFYSPKYSAATGGCTHVSTSVVLSEGTAITLILESDCPIDWYDDQDDPRPRIGILFPQMKTYVEDSGWVTFSSRAIEIRNTTSSNEGRRVEVVLIVHPDNSGAYIPDIYKLYVINFDPDNLHYFKYDISLYSGELPPEAS